MAAPVRVVLAGAHGHGGAHLTNLRRLQDAGAVTLAGVCDVRPVPPERLAGSAGRSSPPTWVSWSNGPARRSPSW